MIHNGFYATVHKTTKVNINEQVHMLPPDCGTFEEFKVADYNCPEEWSKDGIFIPVKEGDPLWFDFRMNEESAVLATVQRLNPLTGIEADLSAGLGKDPVQNYMRLPEQLWLDGYVKDGIVYQFVVTKAGIGLAVNEHLLPVHLRDSHAIGFAFFAPKNPKPKPLPINPIWKILPPVNYDPHWHWHHWNNPWNNQWEYGDFVFDQKKYRLKNDGVLRSANLHGMVKTSGTMDTHISNAETQMPQSLNYVGPAEQTCFAASDFEHHAALQEVDKASMGMGGRITQRIVTDVNSVDYYKSEPSAVLTIYFALPAMFKKIMKHGPRQHGENRDAKVEVAELCGVAVPLI